MNLYNQLWKNHLQVIALQMKNAVNGTKEIPMSKPEFEVYGNRKSSDYFINLEIDNGKVINNISGTAVARDLFACLKEDAVCNSLFANRYYKFSLGKEFILRISIK